MQTVYAFCVFMMVTGLNLNAQSFDKMDQRQILGC